MLSAEIIAQVRQLQIRTGRQVADVLAGEYHSVFKGQGIEFDEVRPYVPGDDIRTIDWNVTARMGEPFIKRFVEQRELTVLLVVDISASQDFGSGRRSKREAAVELSALLAFSASQNQDKVGLLLFHGGAEAFIPPRKGPKHALRVVREVLAHGELESDKPAAKRHGLRRWLLEKFLRLRSLTRDEPRRETNIAHALEFCQKLLHRKAVIFLISDFLDTSYLDTLQRAHRRHDVVCTLITDARELEPTNAGLLTLEDAETGRVQVVDTGSKAFRRATANAATERIETLRKGLRSSGIDLIHIDATGSTIDPLIEFFRARQRRIRR